MNTPTNPFRAALKAGQMQYGFWLGLCNPLSAELLGHTGYDWLLIDGEHAPNHTASVLAQLQAIGNTRSHAVVRLIDDNPSGIKQALDMGAQSLLVPMIESAEQARQLVRSVHYPPRGVRGVGTALARAAAWNQRGDYFNEVAEQVCLLAQIESVAGLRNLDQILEVDGIDGIFIGPADLAASMGHLGNPTHPDVVAAIDAAMAKIQAAGLPIGTLATNRTVAEHYRQQGAQFIALGVDTLALAAGATAALSAMRGGDSDELGNGAY